MVRWCCLSGELNYYVGLCWCGC